MENKLNLETYLFLGFKKIEISVHDKENFKKIYSEKINYDNRKNNIDLSLFDLFLEKNIFVIEKKFQNFIENINLIIESYEFFEIELSIRKKNYGETITKENLKHLLNEAKTECKKTLENKKIVHLTVENYLVNGKKFSYFPNNMKCDFFSIDLKFNCLPKYYIYQLETILRKYQISIDHILNSTYIDIFREINQSDRFETSMKMIKGLNKNEVLIIPEKSKNKGFFERFFDFFN